MLKIGIISDIHSNILAFRAAVEKLEEIGCEEYFLLGDYVSDTPYTRETMEYLYSFLNTHTCHILRGNREEYMLTQRKNIRENNEEDLWIRNSASGNLLFTYEQLTETDLDFFESLPISFVFEKEGYPSITCCHGSLVSTRELVQFYRGNSKEWLDRIETSYMICAHTHLPGVLEYHGKWYYNAGCVGIAISDAGFAQCMYIEAREMDDEIRWIPTFLKVPYDNKQVAKDVITSGLLDVAPWFVSANLETLLTGKDQASEMVKRAAQMAGEHAKWPHIDECYFAAAAAQLDIELQRSDSQP